MKVLSSETFIDDPTAQLKLIKVSGHRARGVSSPSVLGGKVSKSPQKHSVLASFARHVSKGTPNDTVILIGVFQTVKTPYQNVPPYFHLHFPILYIYPFTSLQFIFLLSFPFICQNFHRKRSCELLGGRSANPLVTPLIRAGAGGRGNYLQSSLGVRGVICTYNLEAPGDGFITEVKYYINGALIIDHRKLILQSML